MSEAAAVGRFRSTAREILAAVVTFSAMSYILCVQPALMSGEMAGTPTGMNTGALLTTTCLVSAFGCFLMGFWARYPFALAPGMGENFFTVLGVMPLCAALLNKPMGEAAVWQLALGVVFISGLLFLLLTLLGVRTFLIRAVSPSLKTAFGVGIGLFIADLGLKNAGFYQIIENQPKLGTMASWDMAIFFLGLIVSVVLTSRRVPGAILIGMFTSAMLALAVGKIHYTGLIGLPNDPSPVMGKMDLSGVIRHLPALLPSFLILCFMDVFDTFGTVVGIGQKAGMMKDGTLPRCERVFAADALATLFGALGGQSTVTSFLESAAGVESGGRTGLTAVLVGVFFLLSLFFTPNVLADGGCASVTAAAALVFVGMLMMQGVGEIEWSDPTEALPAFVIIAGIPLTQSIADGIIFGLILWPILKLLTGRARDVAWPLYPTAILLIAYAVFVH